MESSSLKKVSGIRVSAKVLRPEPIKRTDSKQRHDRSPVEIILALTDSYGSRDVEENLFGLEGFSSFLQSITSLYNIKKAIRNRMAFLNIQNWIND